MSANPFYNSAFWVSARAAALKRDRYLCQDHLARGRFVAATTVHHKQHLKAQPELALDADNLVSLCEACHNRAHPEKQRRKAIKQVHTEVYKL